MRKLKSTLKYSIEKKYRKLMQQEEKKQADKPKEKPKVDRKALDESIKKKTVQLEKQLPVRKDN